jgi:hypothetical protein
VCVPVDGPSGLRFLFLDDDQVEAGRFHRAEDG